MVEKMNLPISLSESLFAQLEAKLASPCTDESQNLDSQDRAHSIHGPK
ncbi:hypothetical protein [Candidatus Hoaglandella endobia]|nr:hypothetical protein [Candidatus Hoaglandella endobia]